MAECPVLAKCPFFNDKMLDRPATAELYKQMYCRGDNTTCARFMVRQALGPERVPPDLYPNDTEQAKVLIARK